MVAWLFVAAWVLQSKSSYMRGAAVSIAEKVSTAEVSAARSLTITDMKFKFIANFLIAVLIGPHGQWRSAPAVS